MKVLIVNNLAPFVRRGAEELATTLAARLVDAGHESEVIRIPFRWEPATGLPSQMLLVRALELRGVDRVIALKFPAYLIRHRQKVVWLLDQYRQAYDLRGTARSNLPRGPLGDELADIIRAADTAAFKESRAVFANSEATRDRLRRHNGVKAEVLRPPLNDPELFTGGPHDGYVLAGGRVSATNRQHLLVEAMALAPATARLVVAGPPESNAEADRLRSLVERHGLTDRVVLDLRFVPRRELADLVNHATAVACVPLDEDSLGYVAMEAAEAAKPVLTTRDSHGVLGLVREGRTGWVTDPTPRALGGAIAAALGNPGASRARGEAARDLWRAMDATWPTAIERLLAADG